MKRTLGIIYYGIFNKQLLCETRDTLIYEKDKFSTPLKLIVYWKEAKLKKKKNTCNYTKTGIIKDHTEDFIDTSFEDEEIEEKKSEVIFLWYKSVLEPCLPIHFYFLLSHLLTYSNY